MVRTEHMQLKQMNNMNKGTDNRSQKGCVSKQGAKLSQKRQLETGAWLALQKRAQGSIRVH